MEQYVINKNNGKIKERVKVSRKLINSDEELKKIIKKAQMDAVKNCIPMNFKKVEHKVITKVYKIPTDIIIEKEKDSEIKEKSKKVYRYKKFLSNTNSNDKIRRKYNYQFDSFPLRDLNYYNYNQSQTSRNFYPNNSKINNYCNINRKKSPFLHSSLNSTKMNTLNNFYNGKDKNSLEFSSITDKCGNPINIFQSHNSLNSSLRGKFFNNIDNFQQSNMSNTSRIQHRKINVNRNSIDYANNNYEYAQNNKIINTENYLNKGQKINLNSNFRKPYYTTKNSYIIRSPTKGQNKRMSFMNDKNYECPKNIIEYEDIIGGKIEKILEKRNSKDKNYIISTTSSKKIYDRERLSNKKEEIEIHINDDYEDDINDNKFNTLKNFGDNYKFLEIKNIRNHSKNGNTFHCRRSPIHVFGVQNFVIKDNKRIFLKEMLKGKMLRLYRNNSSRTINHSNRLKNKIFNIEVEQNNMKYEKN